MEQTTMITRLDTIYNLFAEDFGVNQSNKGFNLISELINDLRQELSLKGYKGSAKKRIAEALKYQKEMFKKGGRKYLGLCKYDGDTQYLLDMSWAVKLQRDDVIKELKSTDDTFVYEDKKTRADFDPKSSNENYPSVYKTIFNHKCDGVNYFDIQKLFNMLEAHKDKDYVGLQLEEEVIYFDTSILKRALTIANLYDSSFVKFEYNKGSLKPTFWDENTIICPIRYFKDDALVLDIRA